MRLEDLLAGVALETTLGPLDGAIAEVRDDSRAVAPGDLFIAVRGQTVDGHRFVEDAIARGARAVVVESDAPSFQGRAGATILKVASSARALGQIAANRYGRPADHMVMVGITGTNGKTTTTFLTESIVRAAGGEPGLLGTVEYRYCGQVHPAPYTTPTPLALHAMLAKMRAAGCTHVAMECSSHALALDRLAGVQFSVAAFTNLTQDHLDFHGTMEHYRQAKERLFVDHLDPVRGTGVVLIDRPYGREIAAAAGARVLTVSLEDPRADIFVRHAEHTVEGTHATFETPAGAVPLHSRLIGNFNLENLALALGIGVALGLDPVRVARGIESVQGVPGRLERVPDSQLAVFVDYAHTPDALERVMAALRPLVRGRLIVVFGCGGDRDRSKRPLMGAAVAREANLAIVTSDNPRTEAPDSIIATVLEGINAAHCPRLAPGALAEAERGHIAVVDRNAAIGLALSTARLGDVVLIAGKGHESYQIVGETKLPFDDRRAAAEWLQKVASSPGKALT